MAKCGINAAAVVHLLADRRRILQRDNKERGMPKAVIEDWGQFVAFLAAQPLCKWSAQKQQEMARGMHSERRGSAIHPPAPKNDNAELAAALSSMA
jgi:hypothetical protein